MYLVVVGNWEILDIFKKTSLRNKSHQNLYDKYSKIYGADITIMSWLYKGEFDDFHAIMDNIRITFKDQQFVSMRSYGIGKAHYDVTALPSISQHIRKFRDFDYPVTTKGDPSAYTSYKTYNTPLYSPTSSTSLGRFSHASSPFLPGRSRDMFNDRDREPIYTGYKSMFY